LGRVDEIPADRREAVWLSLGEAAHSLGINAGTLRRWADRGEIASYTTPGGHRRFPRSAITALLPPDRARRPNLSALGASGDRIAAAYRTARESAPRWLATMGAEERELFRERGHRMAECLIDHLDADSPEPAMANLHEAAQHAADYGRDSARLGASLSAAVEAFLRFRAPFIEELAKTARSRGLHAREAMGLLLDAETAADSLLIAFIAGWQSATEALEP
jgi:excisionase family DNA binding protein